MNIVVVGLLLVLAGEAKDPEGAAPASLVDVAGSCPGPEALMDALLPVIGKDALHSNRGPTRVVDLGDRFEVSAAGQTARYVDSGRDCGERARVAAVYIALALSPPSVHLVEPAPPPPPPPQPEPRLEAPGSSRSSPLWARVEAVGRLDVALAEDGAPSDMPAGGELRGMVGRGAVGIAVSVAVLAPTSKTLQAVSVRQQRSPFGVGLAVRHRLSPWFEVGGNAGVVLALLTLRGENVSASASSTRLDPGAHLAIELRGPPILERLVPVLGLHAEVFPRSYVLDAEPVGRVGITNRLWWGATAGLSFDLASGE